MSTHINPDLEILSYAEARAELFAVNPDLCREIDALNVDHRYPLLKARYRYGDFILNKGRFHLPDGKGGLVFRNAPECDSQVRGLLEYVLSMPMTVVHNHGLELFLDHRQRPMPFGIGKAGHIFALTIVLEPETYSEPTNFWSICAGSRSVHMLPKLSDTGGYDRICRELKIPSVLAVKREDPFTMFKAIASAEPGEPWTVEVFVFTSPWFADRTSTPWRNFREYLFSTVWRRHGAYRMTYDHYGLILSELTHHMKPSPDWISTLLYWIYMAQNHRLGHHFAMDDTLLPTAWLQKVYTEIYRLRNHQRPDILCPAYLKDYGKLLYSLIYPTRSDFLRPNSQQMSNRETLDRLLHMGDALNHYLAKDTEKELGILHAFSNAHFQGIHPQATATTGRIISTEAFAQQYPPNELGEMATQSRFLCGAVEVTARTRSGA